ncbi:MAG: DUF2851 family protein [Bacteroidetes bacterium]|nr:DUF2851 family protein [Bacteroidota bacterium]
MKENLLHFLWQNLLFDTSNITSEDNSQIQIIKRGTYNTDSGPDFLNAKIKINDTIWAGNIEIHVKSSDWHSHNHHKDINYNNTILHVCWEYDKPAYRKDGTEITCITLKKRVKSNLLDRYTHLMNNKNIIPCSFFIKSIDELTWKMWEERMLIERLENKTSEIFKTLEKCKNDWHQAFYEKIAWSFGLKINAETFQNLAINIPIKILSIHKNNLTQIEAMLFGTAGFLNFDKDDDYYRKLQKEYIFLKHKYKLDEISNTKWKLLRLRPANFPTVRIAQFANLIHKAENMFSKILENPNIKFIETLLKSGTSEYWKKHYNFGVKSTIKQKSTGDFFIYNTIINTIVPFVFAYGKYKDDEVLKEKAISILNNLTAEKNSIITKWKELGFDPKNSFQTQAILQLNNEYCNNYKCLNCSIGFKILKNGTN